MRDLGEEGSRQGHSTCKGPEAGKPEPQPQIRASLWSAHAAWGGLAGPREGFETAWGSPTRTRRRGLMDSGQASPCLAAAWWQSRPVRGAGLAPVSSSPLTGRKLAPVKQRHLSPLLVYERETHPWSIWKIGKSLRQKKPLPAGVRPHTYPGERGGGDRAELASRRVPSVTCLEASRVGDRVRGLWFLRLGLHPRWPSGF